MSKGLKNRSSVHVSVYKQVGCCIIRVCSLVVITLKMAGYCCSPLLFPAVTVIGPLCLALSLLLIRESGGGVGGAGADEG